MWWNVLQHHTSCSNFGTFTHADIAENLGPGTDQHAVANFRVAVAFILTRAAQSNGLQDRDIVADYSRLPNNHTRGVIQHDAVAQTRCRVNIDTKFRRHTILEK